MNGGGGSQGEVETHVEGQKSGKSVIKDRESMLTVLQNSGRGPVPRLSATALLKTAFRKT